MATNPTPYPNGAPPTSTIPYTSAAAGHQGISTTADGTLLIKPCTAAEIAFYESAKDHPSFQAHMPVYMGSLSPGSSEVQKLAPELVVQQGEGEGQARGLGTSTPDASSQPPKSTNTNTTKSPTNPPTGPILSSATISQTPSKPWTPSGGAKLTSNLSIVLSNATAGFTRPNVCDLKLGSRLWDDDAPVAKRANSMSGMGDDDVQREVNTEIEVGYKTYNKFYGRSNIQENNVWSVFEGFLYSLGLRSRAEERGADGVKAARRARLRRKLLIERFLREVRSIEYTLENEESRMYSASVLMVYEGDPDALESVLRYKEGDGGVVDVEAIEPEEKGGEGDEEDEELDEDDDEEVKQKLHEVVMIDFAHARWTPGEGPDENVLKGIRSIRAILEQQQSEIQKSLAAS